MEKKDRSFKDKILNCPRCGQAMDKLERESIVVDKCKKCEGIWLDKGDIEALTQMVKVNTNGKEKKDV